MRKLQVEIEHLPYTELNPNSREHFMVKARAVKASREEIGWQHYGAPRPASLTGLPLTRSFKIKWA